MTFTKTIALLLCLVGTAGGTSGALCIPPPRSAASASRSAASFFTPATPPPVVDWRAHGAVTPVMHQGHLIGSCWAISGVGAIEGLHKIRTGRLVSLSSQQIYDCSNKNTTDSYFKAFEWVFGNRGVASEHTYPYAGRQQTCKRDKLRMISASIAGYATADHNEQDLLLRVSYQPVSVMMMLDAPSFTDYTGGIFTGPCGNNSHAMLAVGFGALADGRKYWILKNSFGVHWGDHGYFYVQRGHNHRSGLCGLVTYAAYPF